MYNFSFNFLKILFYKYEQFSHFVVFRFIQLWSPSRVLALAQKQIQAPSGYWYWWRTMTGRIFVEVEPIIGFGYQ